MATVCGLLRVMARAGWNGVDVDSGETRGSVTREDLNPRSDHRLELCFSNPSKTHTQPIKDSSAPYSTGNNFSSAAF